MKCKVIMSPFFKNNKLREGKEREWVTIYVNTPVNPDESQKIAAEEWMRFDCSDPGVGGWPYDNDTAGERWLVAKVVQNNRTVAVGPELGRSDE